MDDADQCIRAVFHVLEDVNKLVGGPNPLPHDGTEILNIIENHISTKDNSLSTFVKRLTHFIIYLNTELRHCNWVRSEPMLKKYIHGEQLLSTDTYLKIVEVMELSSFMIETIEHTPYSFYRDLLEIAVNQLRTMYSYSQLTFSEDLVLALLKNLYRIPLNHNVELPFMSHFNGAMMCFGRDYVPKDIRRLDSVEDSREITKYNGFRLRTIFKIFVEIIKFKISTEPKIQYPLYQTTAVCDSSTETVDLFKQFIDIIMYKCTNMCNFSVDTWLSWFEINFDEDTTLQSAIGHLCYDLCTFVDKGIIDEKFLHEFKPILLNIAIERIDFTNIDVNDIDGMLEYIDKNPKYVNGLVKKLVTNDSVFTHSHAIEKLNSYVESIDYNCFKFIVDRCLNYFITCNQGCVSLFDTPLSRIFLNGVINLDTEDKSSFLKHIIATYSGVALKASSNYDSDIAYVVHNELNNEIDQNELMSKLICLVMQQPLKVFNLLISQFIIGINGSPVKVMKREKSCLDQVLIEMHLGMPDSYIFAEYISWLNYPQKYSCSEHRGHLYQWFITVTQKLNLIKPKKFLKHILTPILCPSSDFKHTSLLIVLVKSCLSVCNPNAGVWNKLIIQCARILDNARWNMKSYSVPRAQLCENIILTIQSLLHCGVFVGPIEMGPLTKELSSLDLMTRAHFMCLWRTDCTIVDGMEEHFIMTIHSQNHISYSNLNASSSQKAQEEFIFSIAIHMPKFTMKEMKSFIIHYLNSTNDTNILEASLFLWDCVMNACMRIIVHLKIGVQNDPKEDECAWKYLDNNLVNFIDATNVLKTKCIYQKDMDKKNLKFNSLCKMLMVVKYFSDGYQVPLLIVIRRLIDSLIEHLDAEKISKLLSSIAPLNIRMSCRETLGNTVELLAEKLQMCQSTNS